MWRQFGKLPTSSFISSKQGLKTKPVWHCITHCLSLGVKRKLLKAYIYVKSVKHLGFIQKLLEVFPDFLGSPWYKLSTEPLVLMFCLCFPFKTRQKSQKIDNNWKYVFELKFIHNFHQALKRDLSTWRKRKLWKKLKSLYLFVGILILQKGQKMISLYSIPPFSITIGLIFSIKVLFDIFFVKRSSNWNPLFFA